MVIIDENSFGQYLRSLRTKRDLTLNELSKLTGVSQPHLSHIENGKRRVPYPETLQKFSEALRVPYSEMLERAGYDELAKGQLQAEISHSEKIHILEQNLGEDNKLGDVLRSFREAFGYSIEQFSSITNLPLSYLNDLEANNIDVVDENTISILAKPYESQITDGAITDDAINIYATFLKIAGFPLANKDGSVNSKLRKSLSAYIENAQIKQEAERAKGSIFFSSDTLTPTEKKIIYDLAESLVRNRDK